MAAAQGAITLADNALGRERKIRESCIIPGIILAGLFLSSLNILPNEWMAIIPCGIAKFFLILLSFYGGISILKDLTMYFMKFLDK